MSDDRLDLRLALRFAVRLALRFALRLGTPWRRSAAIPDPVLDRGASDSLTYIPEIGSVA